jgi:hypothetical protein
MTDISRAGRNIAITLDGRPLGGADGAPVTAGDLVPGNYYEISGTITWAPMENRAARRAAPRTRAKSAQRHRKRR